MKKLLLILFSISLLTSCSKDDEESPFPTNIEGYYKLVKWDSGASADFNKNGILEDNLTEYTTAINAFNTNTEENLLNVGITNDCDFNFRLPGDIVLKDYKGTRPNDANARWWSFSCNSCNIYPDEHILFEINGRYVGSGYGYIRSVEYLDNYMIIKLTSIELNEKKKEYRLEEMRLFYKFLAKEERAALDISKGVEFKPKDLPKKILEENY